MLSRRDTISPHLIAQVQIFLGNFIAEERVEIRALTVGSYIVFRLEDLLRILTFCEHLDISSF